MNELFDSGLNYLASLDSMELTAVLTGLLYVILAAKGRRSCWIAGIISCSIIAWKDATHYQLYADMVLQIFYVVVGFIGLFRWQSRTSAHMHNNSIIELSSRNHFILISMGMLSSLVIWILLSTYTSAALPVMDSITTVFAVLATILLLYKVKSNWLYWIGINSCYIYIYNVRDAQPIAFLSLVYLILAIYGYYRWHFLQGLIKRVN